MQEDDGTNASIANPPGCRNQTERRGSVAGVMATRSRGWRAIEFDLPPHPRVAFAVSRLQTHSTQAPLEQ